MRRSETVMDHSVAVPGRRGAARSAVGALLCLALCTAGCQKKARAPETLVPADADVVISMPRIDAALAAYKAVAGKFTDVPAVSAALAEGKASLLKELALDLDNPQSLRARGIDPGQGLYAFLRAADEAVCVTAAVTDDAAADALVREVLRRTSDKPLKFQEAKAGGGSVTEAREEGGAAKAVWLQHRKSLLLCAGDKPGNLAEYTVSLTQQRPEQALTQRADYKAVRAGIGSVFVWGFVTSATMQKWARTEPKFAQALQGMRELQGIQALSLGLDASAQEVALRSFLLTTPAGIERYRSMTAASGKPADFGRLMSVTRSLLFMKASVNMPMMMDEVAREMAKEPASERQKIDQVTEGIRSKTGLDVRKDVLDLLSGRFLAVVERPSFGLDEVMKAAEPRSVVPRLPIFALLQIKDRARTAALLGTIEREMRAAGAKITVDSAAQPVYTVWDENVALLSYRLLDDVLVVSMAGHMDELHRRAKSPEKAAPGAGSGALGSDNVIYVDLQQVGALLHAIDLWKPDLHLDRAMPVMDKLRDLTMGTELRADGARFETTLRFR